MRLCNHLEASQTTTSLRLKKEKGEKEEEEEEEEKLRHLVKNYGATKLLRWPKICSLLGVSSVSGSSFQLCRHAHL